MSGTSKIDWEDGFELQSIAVSRKEFQMLCQKFISHTHSRFALLARASTSPLKANFFPFALSAINIECSKSALRRRRPGKDQGVNGDNKIQTK